MGYYDEINQAKKELKKALRSAGIKNVSITGNKGTAYDWTNISKIKKGQRQDWTEQERDILQGDFGLRVGHVSNSISAKSHEILVALHGFRAKKLKKSPAYQKIKEEYYNIAHNTADAGTCVLGAGTIVKHQGKPIDFWKEHGQSECGSWKAEETLKEKIRKMGLEFQHEGGVMD